MASNPTIDDQILCTHQRFEAVVEVNRIVDIGRFVADVKIRCADCGLRFSFVGLPGGLHPSEPRCGIFGLEARMPIVPYFGPDSVHMAANGAVMTTEGGL